MVSMKDSAVVDQLAASATSQEVREFVIGTETNLDSSVRSAVLSNSSPSPSLSTPISNDSNGEQEPEPRLESESRPGSAKPPDDQSSIVLSIRDDYEFKKSESLETNDETTSEARPELRANDETDTIELRFLVRRREAGALIGKRGNNIKRLRETFRSSMFSIPDTGNGPERVVCIVTNEKSLDEILKDLTELLKEKSLENDEQIELKLLIHSSHAGSIIGVGGQSIKKLRNDSKAAIKIYEMCCPLSNERVCAIKAKPPVVVNTIKLVQAILNENPIKGTIKPYDALHFDLNLIDKYGGYFPDELAQTNHQSAPMNFNHSDFHHHHHPLPQAHHNHQHHHPIQHQHQFLRHHMQQANVNTVAATAAAAAAAAANAGCSSKRFQLWTRAANCLQDHQLHGESTEICNHVEQPPVVDPETNKDQTRASTVKTESGKLVDPANKTANRFHPYFTSMQTNGGHRFSYGRVANNFYPTRTLYSYNRFPMRVQYNHANNRQQCNQFFNQTQFNSNTNGNEFNTNFELLANNGNRNNDSCRHMRPCLCMFLPTMMHNQFYQPQQQQQPPNHLTSSPVTPETTNQYNFMINGNKNNNINFSKSSQAHDFKKK